MKIALEGKEMSCATSNTLIKYALSQGANLGKLLEAADHSLEFLTDTSNWVSHAEIMHLFQRLTENLGDEAATLKAGQFSHSLRSLGHIEVLGKLLTGPDVAYKLAGQYAKRFNLIFEYMLCDEGTSKRHKILRVKHKEKFKPNKLGCNYTRGILMMVPTGWGLPPANVVETECQVDGEEACVFDIHHKIRGFLPNMWNQIVSGTREEAIRDAYAALEKDEAILQSVVVPRSLMLASQSGIDLGAMVRDATFLFSDIAGYSKISSEIGNVNLARMIADYQSKIENIIDSFGGTFKIIGDGFFAIFGTLNDTGSGNHPHNSLLTGIRSQKIIRKMNKIKHWTQYGINEGLLIRIGINTGEAVVGLIEGYEGYGPEVNLAARLETVCKPAGIMVSLSTWERLKDELKIRIDEKNNILYIHDPGCGEHKLSYKRKSGLILKGLDGKSKTRFREAYQLELI